MVCVDIVGGENYSRCEVVSGCLAWILCVLGGVPAPRAPFFFRSGGALLVACGPRSSGQPPFMAMRRIAPAGAFARAVPNRRIGRSQNFSIPRQLIPDVPGVDRGVRYRHVIRVPTRRVAAEVRSPGYGSRGASADDGRSGADIRAVRAAPLRPCAVFRRGGRLSIFWRTSFAPTDVGRR